MDNGKGMIFVDELRVFRGGVMMKFTQNGVTGKMCCTEIYVGIPPQTIVKLLKNKVEFKMT